MTLYTSMPLEVVLQGIHDDAEPLQEVWANGVRLQVSPIAPGIGKIVRLIDCRLDDYLNPSLAPGSLINYQMTEKG